MGCELRRRGDRVAFRCDKKRHQTTLAMQVPLRNRHTRSDRVMLVETTLNFGGLNKMTANFHLAVDSAYKLDRAVRQILDKVSGDDRVARRRCLLV